MLKRSAISVLALLLTIPGVSKNKKPIMSEVILRARYVDVIVDPDAGTSVSNPAENRVAQSDVESALQKWGRFKTTMETANADLILVVRKGGKPIQQTIGSPRSDHPVIVNPGSPDDMNVGIRIGTPPPLRTDTSTPRTEIGPVEDILEVYRGGAGENLDSVPLWRYAAKNGLQHPSVPAIDKFRKAIEEAEKAKP